MKLKNMKNNFDFISISKGPNLTELCTKHHLCVEGCSKCFNKGPNPFQLEGSPNHHYSTPGNHWYHKDPPTPYLSWKRNSGSAHEKPFHNLRVRFLQVKYVSVFSMVWFLLVPLCTPSRVYAVHQSCGRLLGINVCWFCEKKLLNLF